MSSNRRVESSRANGAKSHGPSTPEGKQRSSLNAIRHGLLAETVLLKSESAENFQLLTQMHVDRFQPADGVEFGMIEEMVAAYWRLHRTWAIETRMFEIQVGFQTTGDPLDRMAGAFERLASSPAMGLMHRYEARLQLMYQRAVRTFNLLHPPNRPNQNLPNEPSPILEHSVPEAPDVVPQPPGAQQHADSEAFAGSCYSLRGWSPAVPTGTPPRVKETGVAA